jgi:general secretion pathway protein G
LKVLPPIRTDRSTLRKRRGRLSEAAFTLIELMSVITIILILMGMAAANYGKFVQRSKEAVFTYDLRTMREMIDHYTADKETPPQSLEYLCPAGYLREVPVDPMTRTREWEQKYDNVFVVPDQGVTGLADVNSKSTSTALDGTKYLVW